MKNAIAGRMNISADGLDHLLKGKATNEIASTVGTATDLVQDFIDGKANAGIASVLGLTVKSTQALRAQVGKRGAIGIIVGLCIGRRQK